MSIGMLRFREANGGVRGVEASRVSDIRPLWGDGKDGVISRICLERSGEYVESIDPAEALMDQYDTIIRYGPRRPELPSSPRFDIHAGLSDAQSW